MKSLSPEVDRIVLEKQAQGKARDDYARASKAVNVKSLDERLIIIERLLGVYDGNT